MCIAEPSSRRHKRSVLSASRIFAPIALGASLLFAATPTPAQTDPFALRPEFLTQAAFSCGNVTIDGNSAVSSLVTLNVGHVVSNGNITLTGSSKIQGNATAGPGKTIQTTGTSKVTGTKGNLTTAWPCSPVDLASLAQALSISNDNALIPKTSANRNPLSGSNPPNLTLSGNETLVLPAGTYYIGNLKVGGSSALSVSGEARLLVTGTITIDGNSPVNMAGAASNLRLFTSGTAVTVAGSGRMKGFVYASRPTAVVKVDGTGALTGGLYGGLLKVSGSGMLYRDLSLVPAPDPLTLAVSESGQPLVEGSVFRRAVMPVVSTAGGTAPVTVAVTLDGTAWNPGTAISADGAHVLVATATDSATPPQQLSVTRHFTIDTQAPIIAVASPLPGAILSASPVVVTGTAVGATTLTLFGAPVTLGTGDSFTVSVPIAEGLNPLAFLARDAAGNESTLTLPVVLDTLPPVLVLETPASGACLAAGASVVVTGRTADAHPRASGAPEGAVSVTLTPPSGPATTLPAIVDAAGAFTVSFPLPASTDGSATLLVTATDALGHVTRSLATLRVDSSTPELSLTLDGAPFPGLGPGETPPQGATPALLNRAVSARSSVRDGAAAPPVATLTLNGQSYVEGTLMTAEGTYLLVARTQDCAGHQAVVHASFALDTTLPALTATTPIEGALLKDPVTTFVGTASADVVSVRVAGRDAIVTPPAPGGESVSFSLAPFSWREGDNTVAIELVDRAGNRATFTRAFRIKTTGPLVEILLGGLPIGTGKTFTSAITPEIRTNEPLTGPGAGTLTVTLDEVAYTPGTPISAPGAHTLAATVRDVADTPVSATASFTIDASAGPALAITSPIDGATLPGPTVDVAGTVSAPHASGPTVVRVNGRTAIVSESGTTWTLAAFPLEPDAPNDLLAVAVDALGRSASAAVQVLVRSGGPKVVLISPADGARTNRRKIDLVGAVVGGAASTVDGLVHAGALTAAIDATGAFRLLDVPLTDGSNALAVTATDAQGRIGQATVTVVSDATPPAVSFTVAGQPLADGASFAGPVTVAVTLTNTGDGASAPAPRILLNGAAVTALSPTTEVAIPEAGGWVLSVVALDAAGNETRASRSFVVDAGGCTLADVRPIDGSTTPESKVTLVGRSGSARRVLVRVPQAGGGAPQEFVAAIADGTFAAGDVPLPVVGENAFQLVCEAAGGTPSTTPHRITRLSAGGPEISISSPAAGALVTTPQVAVSGTLSDPEADLFVNGVKVAALHRTGTAFTLPNVALTEGPNVLLARAVDRAGRSSETRVVVERDTQAPRVIVVWPTSGARFGKRGDDAPVADVTGYVDLGSEPHLQSVVVSSPFGSLSAAIDSTGAFHADALPLGAVSGPVRIIVTATDTAGLSTAVEIDIAVNIQGPALRLTIPADLSRLTSSSPASIPVSGEAWAAEGATVSVNGISLDPATLAWEAAGAGGRRHVAFTTAVAAPTQDGPVGVIVRVEDLAGLSASTRRLLVRDTAAPKTVEIVPAVGATGVDHNGMVLVLFSEELSRATLTVASGFVVTRDGQSEPIVGTFTVAGSAVAFVPGAALTPGAAYRVSLGAGLTDLAGNALSPTFESTFVVAPALTGTAPAFDPAPPSVVCASALELRGTAPAGASLRATDGDVSVTATADASGRFVVSLPLSGNGYHDVSVRVVSRDGSFGPAAHALVRRDCSAPLVERAELDRDNGRITVLFSERMSPATLTLSTTAGDGTSLLLSLEGDPTAAPKAATLSLDADGVTLRLDLPPAADAWWRNEPVRLAVRPPAADERGNRLTAPYITTFFPGGGPGDLSGGFLSGEAYDEASGRPLDGVETRLYASSAALPGAVGTPDAPSAVSTTDVRGRYGFFGDVGAGRYALHIAKPGYTAALRRLPLAPGSGAVPFDARLAPLAAASAQRLSPATGGSFEGGATGSEGSDGFAGSTASGLLLEVAPNAFVPGPSAPTGTLAVRLTPLSGQALPELLPLGWSPLAAADVRLETEEVPAAPPAPAVPPATLSQSALFTASAAHLTLPLPPNTPPSAALVAVRHDVASGRWLTLGPVDRRSGSGSTETVRIALTSPGAVAIVLADTEPSIAPPALASGEGQPLTASAQPSPIPALTASLALDPPVVGPTGRATARVVARSADGAALWPSGLAVQAYLDEKLILSGGGELYEAPFTADLLLSHHPVAPEELDGATPGTLGALSFSVSPSPKASQVLLESGWENVRLYPFPESLERGSILGGLGGTVSSADGVELTLPEGALAESVAVEAKLLTPTELAALTPLAGYDLLAAVRVSLSGRTLARAATLSVPLASDSPNDPAGEARLLLAGLILQPPDGRGAYARLTARATRTPPAGSAAPRALCAPEEGGSPLPLEGLLTEGTYLVLRAQAPLGFATGFVKIGNGNGLANSRVTVAATTTPFLGTADLSRPGGRYAIPVPAGTDRDVSALHPRLNEAATARIATLAQSAVVALDLLVRPVGPSVVSVQPLDGSTAQLITSPLVVHFSEPIDPASVVSGLLTAELLAEDGTPSGAFFNGALALQPDGATLVFTPTHPFPPGRRIRGRLTSGVRDVGGTPYVGPLPYLWSFTTSTQITSGGQIDLTKIRLLLPENGTARILGSAGAIPTVVAGQTAWTVSPSVENATASVACPVTSTPADSTGAFDILAGCASTPVSLSSRVFLKVIDPSGNITVLPLGPYVTTDGLGFVAQPGQKTVFTTPEGVEVTVPAGAFEDARLVRVSKKDPATLGVPLDEGLSVGAYIDVDFEGQAAKSLRLRIPLPADAIVGRQVFAGEPIETPWGRRLRFLSAGRVIAAGSNRLFSNIDGDRPGNPTPAFRALDGSAGRFVQSPWCASAKLPCGAACPGVPAEPPGCNSTIATPAPPGCSACDCSDHFCEVLEEFGSKGAAAIVHSTVLELGTIAGSLLEDTLSFPLQIIQLAFAQTFVFAPPPGNWSGHFALPAVVGVPFEVVVRNGATGWVVAQQSYGGISSSPDIQDIGGLTTAPGGPPNLLDASPFAIVRFSARAAAGSDPPPCDALVLGVEACSTPSGTVELSPVTRFPLADETRLLLVNLREGSGNGTTRTVQDGTFSLLSLPATPQDELLLVVTPGDLDPDGTDVLKLSFDRKVQQPAGAPARLVDCGELPPRGTPSCGPSAAEVPATSELSPQGTQLWVKLDGRLPKGHLFELSLKAGDLLASTPPNRAYVGPTSFVFATRKQPQESVAESAPGVLGDTDLSRDMLRVGNTLFVASATGKLVALDTTGSPAGSPPKIPITPLAVLSGSASQMRTLATDGHGRIFFSVLEGASWAVKAARVEDFLRAGPGQSSPPPPECDDDPGTGRPPCSCTLPPAFEGVGCVVPVLGGVRTALNIGSASALLGQEYLSYAGSLPQGIPVKMEILVQDENPDGGSLAFPDFYARHGGSEPSTKDAQGFQTFSIDLALNAPPQVRPFPRPVVCLGEPRNDRFRRVSIDNLTTGQTWSFDLLDPSWGGPAGTEIARGIRARESDELRIRYNQRAWGYVAIVGSGISVVDLNRFYRTPTPSNAPEMEGRTTQCGRRLSTYEGQELAGLPGDSALWQTTSIAILGSQPGATPSETGYPQVDVYTPLHRFGAIRSTSLIQSPDLMEGGRDNLMNVAAGLRTWTKDVVVFPDHLEPDDTLTDLGFYSLGEAGVLVYDLTDRVFSRRGRLGLPKGATVYKLLLDREHDRLLGGGYVLRQGAQESAVFVWDVRDPSGDPPGDKEDARLLSVVHGPWDGGMAFDPATGLLYTWNGGADAGSSPGAHALPLGEPRIQAYARLRGEAAGSATYEPTTVIAPLGVPIRARRAEEQESSVVDGKPTLNRDDDDSRLSSGFRLRVALPAGLGAELTAKVQSLRELPPERYLSRSDLGSFVGMPGGDGWGDSEAYVTLRRLATSSGVNGPLSATGILYESLETVIAVADPRARATYVRQDAPGTEADEAGQCRRCTRPEHLPAAGVDSDPSVEVLVTGPYLRMLLAEDPEHPSSATRQALEVFESLGDDYRAPFGVVEVAGWAGTIPSPTQGSGAEPALNPAVYPLEAGASIVLTSGEATIETVDHQVPGRALGFAMDRTYRSNVLGYGPLGAAGFTSSLFAELRQVPLFGRSCDGGTYGQTGTLFLLHDGEGHVYRLLVPAPEQQACLAGCPDGFEADGGSGVCVQKGVYLRMVSEDGGYRVFGPDFGSLVFDERGRLREVRDRLRRDARKAEDQGNTLLLQRDPTGQLLSAEDELGRVYSFEYDDTPYDAQGKVRPNFGLLEKIVDRGDGSAASRRTIEYVFDSAGKRLLMEVRLPEVRLVRTGGALSGPVTPTLKYAYAPEALAPGAPVHGEFGKVRVKGFRVPGALEDRVSFQYDPSSGRVSEVQVPGGSKWTLSGPSAAGPAQSAIITEPTGLVTELELKEDGASEPDGRIHRTTAKDVPVTTVLPSFGTTPKSVVTGYRYLPDGRLFEVTNDDQSIETLAYASGDRLSRLNVVSRTLASAGLSLTRRFGYTSDNVATGLTDDGEGRSVTVAVPDPEAPSGIASGFSDGARSKSDFDEHGRVLRVDTGEGAIVTDSSSYYPDARGRAGMGFPKTVSQGPLFESVGYDGRGNVLRKDSSHGSAASFEIDEWDRPIRETAIPVGATAPGADVQAGYDEAGHLVVERRKQTYATGVESTGTRWVETRYAYDERERLTTVEEDGVGDPASSAGMPACCEATAVTTLEYHPTTGTLQRVTRRATNPGDVVTEYEHDVAGRLVKETVLAPGATTPPGPIEKGYDNMGRVVWEADGDTAPGKRGEWKGVYDAWDRLVTQLLPTGATIDATYDDADGLKSLKARSAAGELLAEITDVNVATSGEVTALTESQTADKKRQISRLLDAAGRPSAVTDAGRVEEGYEYEPGTGRLAAKKTSTREERFSYATGSPFANGVQEGEVATGASCGSFVPTQASSVTRDHDGRPLIETSDDGTVTTYSWDEEGKPLVVRQGSEHQILTWDSASRLVRVDRATGRGHTLFRYDLDGRLLERRDVLGSGEAETTVSHYDAAGRLVDTLLPDGAVETYEHDADGEVKRIVRSDGVALDVTRDAANLPQTVIPSPSGIGAPSRALLDGGLRYHYDPLGRLLRTERLAGPVAPASGVGVEMQDLDLAGRPRFEKVGERLPIERTYDLFGRALETTLPSGSLFRSTWDTCTPRLVSATGPGLGAFWAWTGGRLLGITTGGPRKIAHRYGWAGGPGAQIPGAPPEADRGRLATLTHGTAGSSDPLADAGHPLGSPEAPGSAPWGQLAYGYSAQAGHKLGREVSALSANLHASLGWAYQPDAAGRLMQAYSGRGNREGASPVLASDAAIGFSYTYGKGDQLLTETRTGASGRHLLITQGPEGRPDSLAVDAAPAVPIAYDSGRRTEDDRHLYEWYWHGLLARVAVKPGQPRAGESVTYSYDGLGRLYARERKGPDGQLQDRREYVFDGERLVEETSYADQSPTSLRWRKTWLPGPGGAVQVRIERYLPGSATPLDTRFHALLRDEQGSVVALLDEGAAGAAPPLLTRYLYTPFGQAHAESGPELRTARFDSAATSLPGAAQSPAPGHIPGALRLHYSLSLDPASLNGLVLEKRLTDGSWGALLASELARGAGESDGEALLLPLSGWEEEATYRLRITTLRDAYGRIAQAEALELAIPAPPPPGQISSGAFEYEKTFPVAFSTPDALLADSPLLFHGLYHDDLTGLAWTPGRWYDAATASWLSRDEGSDGASAYAFGQGRPHELVDPTGEGAQSLEDLLAEEAGEGEDEAGDASAEVGEALRERLDVFTSDEGGDITCLSSDTVVLTPEGYEAIGGLSVGSRVLTPETLRSLEAPSLNGDLRLVSLRLTSPSLPGSVVEIETLVSTDEIEAEGLHIGARVPLDAEGLDEEEAEVVGIGPAPALSGRPGRLVTSTFRHVRTGALRLTLETSEGPTELFVTKEHPFYVEGQGWRRLEELSAGACVTTAEGDEARIAAVEALGRDVVLCNLEVEGEHAFFAGRERVLVHNGGAGFLKTFSSGAAAVKATTVGTRISRAISRYGGLVGRMRGFVGQTASLRQAKQLVNAARLKGVANPTIFNTPRGLYKVADEVADEITKAARLSRRLLDSGQHLETAWGKIYHSSLAQKKGMGWFRRMARGSAVQQITDAVIKLHPDDYRAFHRARVISNSGSAVGSRSLLSKRLLRPDFQIDLGGGKWAVIDLTQSKQAPKILKYSHRDVPYLRNIFY